MVEKGYLGLLILVVCSWLLSGVVLWVSYVVGERSRDIEKVSVYECGFDPFGSSRVPFSVKFYLIGILFLIFDLEISFLFPWSVVLGEIESWGNWVVYIFLIILTIGLIYEWGKGGLEWE